MFWHTVPSVFRLLAPKRTWLGNPEGGTVYLTFDDGPVPGVTDYVLDELDKRGQRATFFMVGDNVRKHERLAHRILERGNQVGNHTFHHLNGWKTDKDKYLRDVEACDQVIQEVLGVKPRLFRPPYGLMTSSQASLVSKSHQLIMWSILSGDYSPYLAVEEIVKHTIRHTQPGAIVVFHDQLKTSKVLPHILPLYLDYIQDRGWTTSLL